MLQDVYSLSIVGLNIDMVGIDDMVLQSLCNAAPFAPTMDSDEVCRHYSLCTVFWHSWVIGQTMHVPK